VLALHGWLDNAASFNRLAPRLAPCRVVSIDQRGHGHSEHAAQAYHIWDGVPDVVGILDALGWEQAILLGHSMGAAVATLTASAFPERVAALWLIEGFGPWPGDATPIPDRLRMATERAQRQPTRRKRVYPTIDEAIAARLQGAVAPISHEAAADLVRRGLMPVENGYVWSSDPRLTVPSMMCLDEAQVQSCIARLTMPISLALGTTGLACQADFMNTRIALCPQMRVETFTGGHHLHLESAAGAIASWFKSTLEHA
jgi:pimeloyl-ACP methyl ester carboxylesterase